MPGQDFTYLGDAARLPYGTKSPQTVERYAIKAARLLLERGVCALIVACNTASAVALAALRREFAPLPVFGVVTPGAEAASEASKAGRIAVIATEGSVRGGAYVRALLSVCPQARIRTRSASLLVTLAEDLQGQDAQLAEMIVRHSIRGLIGPGKADTLLLGCTHFPALRDYFLQVLPSNVRMVDSATEVAKQVAATLAKPSGGAPRAGARTLLCTDNPARFARLGSIFLGEEISAGRIELVELS